MSRISEGYIRRLIKEAVINEIEKASKIAQAAEDVISQLPDGSNIIARAKKYAKGKPFTYVRDANDEYVYAAIGGDLSIENFSPEYFVCVFDGVRKDRATLGYKFVPGDKGYRPMNIEDFRAVEPDVFANMTEEQKIAVNNAAEALRDEYKDMNTFQYIVFKVKNKTLPAGELIANAPPKDEPAAVQNTEGIVATVATAPGVIEGGGEVDTDTDEDGDGKPDGTPGTGPSPILVNPKPRPWWKFKFPRIPWFKRKPKGEPSRGEDDDSDDDSRRRDRERKRADKEADRDARRSDKARSKARVERWNEVWNALTRAEKRLFVALVNDDPSAVKLAVEALRAGEYSDTRFGDVLDTSYPGTLGSAGYATLSDARKVNNFQYDTGGLAQRDRIRDMKRGADLRAGGFNGLVQLYPRLVYSIKFVTGERLPESGDDYTGYEDPTTGPFKELVDAKQRSPR